MKKLLVIALACSVLLSACDPKEVRLAHRCLSSSVLLHMKVTKETDEGTKQGLGTCSGVYVSPHLILTADHCVDMPANIKLKEIWVRNYYGDSAKATIVKVNHKKDLALLKTTMRGTPARLARDVKVGEDCWVIGNPLGFEFIVSKGIVSSTDLQFPEFPIDHFITDAVVMPGSSGGAAFNSKGQLIGIVTMTTSMLGMLGASGLGIVVQIDEVRDFLRNK